MKRCLLTVVAMCIIVLGKIDGLKCRLQGMVIRDEFLCPIMYQLFRDPVIAQDGHTYERTAIEKWLEKNSTSPRTGHVLNSKVLIANLNIHKLIQDFIAEGGVGLYTHDVNHSNRSFYVFAQKILMLKCLGPPESSWNMRTFEVNAGGCMGGRRLPADLPSGMDPVHFSDCSTVSRSHFEVRFDTVGKYYTIRDLGSAGGTFVRIPHGKKKLLTLGSMLLLGKHQFIVSDVTTNDGLTTSYPSDPKTSSDKTRWFAKLMESCGEAKVPQRDGGHKQQNGGGVEDLHKESDDSLHDLVGDANELLRALSAISTNDDRVLIEEKVRKIRDVAAEAARMRSSVSGDLKAVEKQEADPSAQRKGDIAKESKSGPVKKTAESGGSGETEEDESDTDKDYEREMEMRCRLVLTCFAPDGSPLLGKSFEVDHTGATIGRKTTNKIALLLNQNDRVTHLDSAVSSEHARIELDQQSGSFFLSDGNGTKPSTNGCWFRLSPPSQKSAPHELKAGMEILIGTIRFQAHERTTLTEETIPLERDGVTVVGQLEGGGKSTALESK